MTYRGVVRGATIELEQPLPFLEGQEVCMEVHVEPPAFRHRRGPARSDAPAATPSTWRYRGPGTGHRRRKAAGERSLDENDLWMAATALALGATLVTETGTFKASAASMWNTGRSRSPDPLFALQPPTPLLRGLESQGRDMVQ
jgi:hypothetical protein